jgi:uncharacterized Tic20 family protein
MGQPMPHEDSPPEGRFQDDLPDRPPRRDDDPLVDHPDERSLAVTADDRQWGMFAHLSALLGLFVGGMTFLGPLIVWLAKKDQSRFVDYHGKEALNFQLNILIYSLILVAASVVTCGVGLIVTIPLFMVLGVWGIVMPIIAGMKANQGERYEYPATFRIIK